MSGLTWPRLPWLFNRRVGTALFWAFAVFGTAFTINVIGIHLTGSIDGWKSWLHAHSAPFFAWRLCLYGAMAYFWWQTHRHLRQRQSSTTGFQRLRLIGVGAVIIVLIHEGSGLLQIGR